MYAVFETGGLQFNAEEGARLKVPHLNAKEGDKISIDKVLLVKDGDNSHVGTPYLDSAKVEVEVLSEGHAEKITVFKFKRRTKYRKTRGHKQMYTEIMINKIVPPAG